MDPLEEHVLRLLTDSTNRDILSALDEVGPELSVSELAREVLARNADAFQPTASDAELQRLRVSLHHEHLPRLDQVGLLTYDQVENVVSAGEYVDIDGARAEITLLDELLSERLTGHGGDETEIEILEGREEVYQYAREMADRAQRELFLIYASSELLDAACLPHAEHAIERGVDLYAGAKSADAREFFRTSLPTATVWEPQLDILNDHASYPTVSRLLFVDRETVVIGLWDEPDDGDRREIGMVGEGARNPLVALTRELLGGRLDHLDYQSDDFLNELPFD